MRKPLHTLLTWALVLCCLAGMIQPVIALAQELPLQTFQVHMVTTGGYDVLGTFAKRGTELLVEAATVKDMDREVGVSRSDSGNGVCVYRKMIPAYASYPNPEIQAVTYTMDEICVSGQGIFVPFSQTLQVLGLNPNVDHVRNRLIITDAGNVDQLALEMEEIYQEACYNMRYWKNSNMYRFTVKFAELLSAARNLDPLSFVFGLSSYEEYREAFSKLIIPQEWEEVDFSTGSDELLGMINGVFSISDDLNSLFKNEGNVDLMGDLSEIYQAVFKSLDAFTTFNENVNGEELAELTAYFYAAKSEEESILRALRMIEEAPELSPKMSRELEKVLDTYDKGSSVWLEIAERVIDQVPRILASYGQDYLVKKFLPQSYLFDIGNELTSFYFDTGNQLSATLESSRYLDIQTCCQKMFEKELARYYSASIQDKTGHLQNMYDLTKLYLKSGLKAQQAMTRMSSLKDVTDYSIDSLKQEMERLNRFSEIDIRWCENCAAAEKWLLSVREDPQQLSSLIGREGLSMDDLNDLPIFITITWNYEAYKHQMDLTADVTGYLDNGASIFRAPSEGEYISNFGRVATHYDMGKWIELEAFRNDALLNVVVKYADPVTEDTPDYQEANVDIHIYNPVHTIAVIAADPKHSSFAESPHMVNVDDFLYTEQSGMKVFRFQLDHGVFTVQQEPAPLFANPLDNHFDDESVGERLVENHTPDGLLQSSELYDADGYLLESRWYDNNVCTAATTWTYDEKKNLTRIDAFDVMDPEGYWFDFVNAYSGDQLQKVEMYNMAGMLIGEGPTAADAADAVGLRMLVERSFPQ